MLAKSSQNFSEIVKSDKTNGNLADFRGNFMLNLTSIGACLTLSST
jgi:hypothetical protein